MSFTVRGHLLGRVVRVTWDDGKLSGDPEAIDAMTVRAWTLEGQVVGFPAGPETTRNHLASSLSALFLMREIIGDDLTATGDVPQLAAIPVGSIA